MLVFFTQCVTKYISRQLLSDNYIKRVNEMQWANYEKQPGMKFLFFHASSDRISDIAYLRYVDISREFVKPRTQTFFVIHALDGDTLARQYRIKGYPTLFAVKDGKHLFEMPGAFSKSNLRRFLKNMTFLGYNEIDPQIVSNCTDSLCIYKSTKSDLYDVNPRLIIFADNSTRFGRISTEYSQTLASSLHVYRIQSKSVAENLHLRYPSLLYINSNYKEYKYSGDPTINGIESWIKGIPSSTISYLNLKKLFDSLVRTPKKSVIKFINSIQDIDYIKELNNFTLLSQQYPKLHFFYANQDEFRSLIHLTNFSESVQKDKFLCISANLTLFSFAKCDQNSLPDFEKSLYSNLHGYQSIYTPSGLYDYYAPMNSNLFSRSNPIENSFIAFYSSNMGSSYRLYEEVELIAKEFGNLGGETHWYHWNVKGDVPSFREDLNLSIPSLWYIPKNDIKNAMLYNSTKYDRNLFDWAYVVSESSFEHSYE